MASVLVADAQLQGEAVRRRRQAIADPDIEIDRAELDIGHPIRDVGLLVLCERRGRVLSRRALVELTRGRAIGPFERSIDILISRLRRKIEADPHHPDIIKTVRAGGYILTPMVEAS
jgi:DNA-binding response OmpR family regulator